jgi:flagellar biogenesis protein FliO
LQRNLLRIFNAPILFVALLAIAPLATSLHAQEGGTKPEDTPQVSITGETATQENGTGETPDYEYEEPAFDENRISYPFMILRTIAVMGVIIIGIYFLFRLLIRNKNRVVTDSDIIKILATYPLAANRIIQVVDIGGQVLVLGVSDSSINLITELEDQEVIDRLKISNSKEKSGAATLRDTFMSLLGGKPYKKPGQISQLSGYKKRINRMRKF